MVELLGAAEPEKFGFENVVLWGSARTLARVSDRDWLIKVHEPALDRGLLSRAIWHRYVQKRRARKAGCDIVFVPGGTASSGFSPVVTMSRNMLPFQWQENKRFGLSLMAVKLLLLRWIQLRSFRKADGLIFLTNYARTAISNIAGGEFKNVSTIPHGINSRFFVPPASRHRREFTETNPCRIIYVSTIDPYKHQWNVVEAVGRLHAEGVPVVLELIGARARGGGRLEATLKAVDPGGTFITYHGELPYESIEQQYAEADIGVFASTCENMPNILLEGMAAGLPMACSNAGPMPEVMGDAGVYFDALNPDSITHALHELITAPGLRHYYSMAALERAKKYTWERSANLTFDFLRTIVRDSETRIPKNVRR